MDQEFYKFQKNVRIFFNLLSVLASENIQHLKYSITMASMAVLRDNIDNRLNQITC